MVCMGNLCRSPMAQAVATQMAHDAGLAHGFEFDSAGTLVHRAGAPPDARTQAVLSGRNYSPSVSRARRVADRDFKHFDLILAMDRDNLATLQHLCPPRHHGKLHLLLAFAPGLGVDEVPDPYYGNLAGFEYALDLCEAGARGLIGAMAQVS